MGYTSIRILAILLLVLALGVQATTALAQKAYDTGASDSEIKIGNIASYTGWAKEYGAIGRAEAAYFKMVNDRGGVHGRKINFISEDTGSQPGKFIDIAHKLVEQDGVLLIFSAIGTENNLAIRDFMNEKKVPQLFVQSSSTVFDDPAHFPWTMGFFATYRMEGLIYAKYILHNEPNAKIAVLYANYEAGKEYLAGLHEGLGDKAATMLLKEVAYRVSDANLDPQILELKNSGADVFFNFSIGAFTSQVVRKTYDADWHPLQFIPNASLSIASFLDPAGLQKAVGIISNARSKGWLQPESRKDPAVREFLEWMAKYNPQASLRDQNNVAGYVRAQVMVEVLNKCGDNLTRANVMRQAASLDMEPAMFRPGIKITTSPTDYQPVKQLYLIKFNGKEWDSIGPVTNE